MHDTLDKGIFHVSGGMEHDDVRFLHASQKSIQFKSYDLFISGIFGFLFLDYGWLQVLNAESETIIRAGGSFHLTILQMFEDNNNILF